jgi:glycosyltransferase involved in cell wall biosynthesis
MRILLIHQYFLEENDGGGSRFNEMARYWSLQGHEITVLAGMMHANAKEKRPEYKGKYFVHKQHGKVKVIRCHVSESYNTNFLGRLWGYFSFVFSSIYAGLFKARDHYDVILVTSPPLFVGITAYVLSKLKRLPFIFEVRDLWPESAIDTGVLTNRTIIDLAYWFETFVYKKAALINVLTPAFRKKLIEEKGVPPEKVIFIPNAADFSLAEEVLADFDRQAFRQKMGWQDKTVITYVGAHGVANHLIQIIETAALLHGHSNAHFVLIGNGMQKEMLVAAAKNRDLSNVEFLDPVPKKEVFQYIAASDVGASVLKKVDTFKTIYSNKTFDYMSCKRPVLMVIDGVSRELVEAAQCGIYAEPENPVMIKEKVLYLAQMTEEEKNQWGISGYQYARQHFDRRQLADDYMHAIEKIVV